MKATLGDRIIGLAGPVTRETFRRARRRAAAFTRVQVARQWPEFGSPENTQAPLR
jgi:hypothetical protein